MDWNPPETAPKDRDILVWNGYMVEIAWWDDWDDEWTSEGGLDGGNPFLCWMDLPEPPFDDA
jgi:hypothetical protein